MRGAKASADAEPGGLLDHADRLLHAGRPAEAEARYRAILTVAPREPDLLYRLAVALQAQGRLGEAERAFAATLELALGRAGVHNDLASLRLARGEVDAALAGYARAIALQGDLVPAHYNFGRACQHKGDAEGAIEAYRRALELCPDLAEAWNNLGNVLSEQGRLDEAETCFRRVLSLRPGHAGASNNLANVMFARNRPREALELYREAAAAAPQTAEPYVNLANALAALGQGAEALEIYDRALALDPDHVLALNNKGKLLQERGRSEEARACFERALARVPDLPEALHNRTNLQKDAGDVAAAIASYERVLALRPEHDDALAQLVHQLQQICDWQRLAEIEPRLDERTHAALAAGRRPGETPFLSLTRHDDPERRLAIARAWATDVEARLAAGGCLPPRPIETRTRPILGYLSGDVREHPVMRSTIDALAAHDRERFDVRFYAYGPDDAGGWRRRVAANVDALVDLDGLLDQAAAAARIHADDVDILVDLTGWTKGSRSGLLALRPAPIQASFLGFPGSAGAGFVDYLVADPIVLPKDQLAHFAEAPAWLPGGFLGHQREIDAGPVPTRGAHGLPEDGIVLCCFNAAYKLEPSSFTRWLRILRAVPGSVLWLAIGEPAARARLRAMAEAAGLDAARLVFAPHIAYEDNLRRLALADLALDCFTYNGGITTANALFAGVPVVSLCGRAYVARMGASLLAAVGLPELAVDSPDAYEELVLALARDPERRTALRAHLRAARGTAPLFDGTRLARELEDLYRQMWRSRLAGEPPAPIRASV